MLHSGKNKNHKPSFVFFLGSNSTQIGSKSMGSDFELTSHRSWILLAILLAVAAAPPTTVTANIAADSIQGCGGFVEASRALIKSRKPTDAKLDYSHITVELRTLDGLVKERTQCAPNGYYFIPVYDKGSFLIKIKGPEGWSWKPEQVQYMIFLLLAFGFSRCIHVFCKFNNMILCWYRYLLPLIALVATETKISTFSSRGLFLLMNASHLHILGSSFHHQFKPTSLSYYYCSFTISGRVVGAVGGESCPNKNGGPSNVKVELLSPSGEVMSSVSTTSTGSYTFADVVPGKYKLRASRDDLNIEVRSSPEVELGFGNVLVDDIFFVSGYEIRGSVVAQGNPILGVHVYLYSDDVSELDCPLGAGEAPGLGKALCHATSDAAGMFQFHSIPCGVYKLVPFYKGENTVFDVSPPSMLVTVGHDHAKIIQKFQVTGFSVGGRVVDGTGMGVDGVKILVDGEERSLTDKEGYYKLDQVTSKRYTIEARKEHYTFGELVDFMVLPNMASLADITAVSYDICGTVQTVSADYKTKVALTHGPENVKPQVKQTDNDGNFCFQVPPGEYRLSAFASTPENAPELLLSPSHVDIKVSSPILNVNFYQAQVNVHGSVVCKERCGSSISVKLVKVDGKGKEKAKTSSLTGQSNEFMFLNILPGKYRIEVKNDSPEARSREDKWCWERSSIDVDIATEDVKGIVFVQKGYWVKVISSHDVNAQLTQPDGSLMDLNIKKGTQNICVEYPGVHELHFVNSCIHFGSSPVKIDTSDSSPLYLKGEKYLLKGHIHVDSKSVITPETIAVDIFNNDGVLVDTVTAGYLPDGSDHSNDAVFEYSLWAVPAEKFTFVPKDSRENAAKKLLFYPRQQEVSVKQEACQDELPPFSGRHGMYIEGSVSPPLSGVHIRALAAGDSINAALRRGDLALDTSTDANGLFVAGPLYDDIEYTIEASKPGYHVKPVGPYSFSCQKLGQISVAIYSNNDANEPFPSALLSLSGEDGYRNNSVTGVGGHFLFENLFPGSFYLRPLLKEYAFSPSALAIELGSGEFREVVFHATRVAYSALGTVTLLSGQPKEGISVEARAESKGFYEEAVTDSSGSYRLRGLLPDTSYVIRIAKKADYSSSRIERASPESIAIKVGSQDIKQLDFVVFEHPEMTILSGHVEGKGIKELHPHLQVKIMSAGEPVRTEAVVPLPLSNFFQVKDLPRGKHLIQLQSTLPASTHRFHSEVIEADLQNQSQVHIGPIRFNIEEDHQKQELTTAPVYPLIAGVTAIALFISMPRIKDLYQALVGMAAGSVAAAAVKKDAKKPLQRKKTY
ncbi:OLC1v1003663C1 [Oldenlandia corymbosa var. corymbosa]|uniref:OLC1v1003663C1 n=1 Tax=Oldenlandia corymbosa var. corymbosa TaxID=529605 RepID=A0AAV1DAJ0_OLDCO|nr:OLC1v1003663C1 [Oldenlandia corymbosa var. corymbosa]